MSSPKPAISRSLGLYFGLICVGYATDLVVYLLLVDLGLDLYAAYLASFAVGATCNVALLRRFFSAPRHSFGKDLALTFGSNGLIVVLMLGLYMALMKLFGMPHLLAKIVSNGVSFMANYATRRAFF